MHSLEHRPETKEDAAASHLRLAHECYEQAVRELHEGKVRPHVNPEFRSPLSSARSLVEEADSNISHAVSLGAQENDEFREKILALWKEIQQR